MVYRQEYLFAWFPFNSCYCKERDIYIYYLIKCLLSKHVNRWDVPCSRHGMFHIHSLGFHMDALFLTWHFSPIFLNSPQIYLPRKGHMNFPLPPPSLTPFLPFWHPSKYATTTAYHQMMQGEFWIGQEDQRWNPWPDCVLSWHVLYSERFSRWIQSKAVYLLLDCYVILCQNCECLPRQ